MGYIQQPLGDDGYFSNWWDDVKDTVGLAVSYGTLPGITARLLEERRLAQAADKAKADRIRMEAERKVREEEATRAQVAAAGGVAIPPPLTTEQRDVAVLLQEHKLRARERTFKGLAVVGAVGLGGFLWWKHRGA